MADEKPFDALRMKAELGARVTRALEGLTPEEQIRWIREEAAKHRSENPPRSADEAREGA